MRWVECSPMVREIWVPSQRFKERYLIPTCLSLSNIRYVSMVKWSNPGKGVAASSTPRCSSYLKGSLLVALDYSRQLHFLFCMFICITFKLCTKWNNALPVSGPTTSILPTTASNCHGLNCFGHMIYAPQTVKSQNIAKTWLYLCIKPNFLF